MRRLLACLALAVTPFAVVAQTTLPQISGQGALRPLSIADASRGLEAIGRLDTGVSYCSGTLIAPDLVLTAAHCVFDDDDNRIDDADMVFSAGLTDGRAEAFGQVSRSFVHEAYTPTNARPRIEQVRYDLALLELAHPVPLASVNPLRTGPRGRVHDVVTVVSYGRDRDNYASIEEDCEILDRHTVVSALSCSVVPGSSGSPILRETPSGLEIAAVVSAVGRWEGREAAFAVDVEGVLPTLIAALRAEGRFGLIGNGSVRRLTAGDDSRDGIGARFVRP